MKNKLFNINRKSLEASGQKSVKDLWEKLKGEYKGFSFETESVFKKSEESEDRFHATFSTATEDRHMEVVYQNFDLSSYIKNPVYLNSHNYESVEQIIGKVEGIGIKEGKLQGDVVFAVENPLGLLAKKLVEGGFLNTSSIGFIPLEFDNEGNILRAEIIEISACSVPANAEALFERKQVKEKEVIKIETEKPASKKTANEIIAVMANKQKNELKLLAKTINEFVKDKQVGKQRKVFKIIRDLLDE